MNVKSTRYYTMAAKGKQHWSNLTAEGTPTELIDPGGFCIERPIPYVSKVLAAISQEMPQRFVGTSWQLIEEVTSIMKTSPHITKNSVRREMVNMRWFRSLLAVHLSVTLWWYHKQQGTNLTSVDLWDIAECYIDSFWLPQDDTRDQDWEIPPIRNALARPEFRSNMDCVHKYEMHALNISHELIAAFLDFNS
jgi:hypothetical protein